MAIWIEDAGIFAFQQDHRRTQSGRLEAARRDLVQPDAMLVRQQKFFLNLLEGRIRPRGQIALDASLDFSAEIENARSGFRAEDAAAGNEKTRPVAPVQPVLLAVRQVAFQSAAADRAEKTWHHLPLLRSKFAEPKGHLACAIAEPEPDEAHGQAGPTQQAAHQSANRL